MPHRPCRLGLFAALGFLACSAGCATSMTAQHSFRSFEPMSVPQGSPAGQAVRVATARQAPPPAARARVDQQVVQAAATVPVPREQLIAPETPATARLAVAPRRSIHDPLDIAPVPPPARLVETAPLPAAKPQAKPAKQLAAAKPAKSAKQAKSSTAKRSAAKSDVALASASKPSRAAKPARREVVIEELAAVEPTVTENGAEADEAETPQTQLTPVAKLPKRTIAKGPQWRAAGTLVAAEPPRTIENKETEELSPVHPASWEMTARPAPAASIDEAEYAEEEPAADEPVAGSDEEAPSGPSRVRIVGMSGG